MSARLRVGIDLAPIGFRSRAPGTAVLVDNQARALLAMDLPWDWVVVATPRALADTPYFERFDPIILPDRPLSVHVSAHLGRAWAKTGCSLGLATAFFAPFFGPPVVTNYFDANSYHSVKDERTVRQQAKSAVIRGLFRFSRRRSRALFILSEHGKKLITEADPATAGKWVVTPCGCQSVVAASHRPEWAVRLGDRPFILYAGAFSENKNQRRLIEAWDRMRRQRPDFPALVLIGPSPADYLREVVEPARQRTVAPEEVIIPGFLPVDEVGWALHAAHAYVQPSFAEGFGMPVVEAMSCGTPVACSDSTSLPEVAGDAAILFDPSSVEGIAQALERLALDPVERARLRAAGTERARKYTWEAHAEIVAGRIREELERLPAGASSPPLRRG